MKLADRILNQKGRPEVSAKVLAKEWRKVAKNSRMISQTSAVKISTIVDMNENKYSYIKPQINYNAGTHGGHGGTGGTVLPLLQKTGDRKKSFADYGTYTKGTNNRRAKSLAKPRPTLDAGA